MTRAITLSDLNNGYKWGLYPHKAISQELLCDFLKSKLLNVGNDKNFDVPVYIDFIGLDCILIFKDGKKVLSKYNHFYKTNTFKFLVDDNYKTFNNIKSKIDTIIFFDDFLYHDDFRKYWSNDGFKSEAYKYKNDFLNAILKEV